jgi:hypothetical protein
MGSKNSRLLIGRRMRRRLPILLTIFLIPCTIFAGEPGQYVIKGGQESLRTDFELGPGDCVQIRATGTIKMGLLTGWNGPEGSSLTWIIPKTSQFPPGALIGALVGKDGETDYFLVGTDAGLQARKAGRLTFFINEAILADNGGEFSITVDRQHLKSLRNKVVRFVESLE